MPTQLTLIQRDDCHLCDLALGVLAAARTAEPASLYIDDDPALDVRYGLRVPVLRAADGRELDWPFDVEAVTAFVAAADGGPP